MDRYEILTIVLQYDSYENKRLTDFDRMFIQSERAAILGERRYKVPAYLEKKIQEIYSVIQQIKWTSPF